VQIPEGLNMVFVKLIPVSIGIERGSNCRRQSARTRKQLVGAIILVEGSCIHRCIVVRFGARGCMSFILGYGGFQCVCLHCFAVCGWVCDFRDKLKIVMVGIVAFCIGAVVGVSVGDGAVVALAVGFAGSIRIMFGHATVAGVIVIVAAFVVSAFVVVAIVVTVYIDAAVCMFVVGSSMIVVVAVVVVTCVMVAVCVGAVGTVSKLVIVANVMVVVPVVFVCAAFYLVAFIVGSFVDLAIVVVVVSYNCCGCQCCLVGEVQ